MRTQDERELQPSVAIIDSQNDARGGERVYDANKRMSGRKYHILVDTMENLLHVVVHPANLADLDDAKCVLERLPSILKPRLSLLWADDAYNGDALLDS